MSPSIAARLIAGLPETLWPEALRRLRRVPELWTLAENDDILAAFIEQVSSPRSSTGPLQATGGSAAQWRPGPMALAAYQVVHPECQGRPEKWLAGAGRERVGAAYAALTTEPRALHPIDEAVPAALALRLRMVATADWPALATEACTHPEHWRLPLQYLWGLLNDGHDQL